MRHLYLAGTPTSESGSLSECLCVRHKLMAKEPLYATQTQGRSDDRTGQGLEPGGVAPVTQDTRTPLG
ncbi:hypothetical protein A8F72_16800 [Burkholderia cenocepacia]|nr:hypothetical protein A8F72_16800 [Burkholderia cenocepacia]